MHRTADDTASGLRRAAADDAGAMTMPFDVAVAREGPNCARGGPATEAVSMIDRFPVVRRVGFGGMGEVFLCRHPVTGLEVAVKRLRPELVAVRQAVQRFLTEARHMYHMSHPHVLRIMEVWDPPAGPYYVMPYMAAGSLADRVPAGQPLEYALTVRAARDVADALAFAHSKGIIHRDLKPANVLLDAVGRAHVSDFGLVRSFDTNDSIEDVGQSQCVGTPAFMSPAVARGEAEDTRCDIYSLGAMLYQLLTGHPPYTGPTPAAVMAEVLRGPPAPILALNPHAHPGLVRVAEGCMARELRDRYATMADVLADLERVAADRPPCSPHGAEPETVVMPPPALGGAQETRAGKAPPESQPWASVATASLAAAANSAELSPAMAPRSARHGSRRAKVGVAVAVGLAMVAAGTAWGLGNGRLHGWKSPVPTPITPVAEPRIVDLLPLVQVPRVVSIGTWQLRPNGLAAEGGKASLSIPYDTPDEYDLRVEFTQGADDESLMIGVPHAGTACNLVFGSANSTRFGFEKVDGRFANNPANPAAGDLTLRSGQRYVVVVQVRRDSLSASLDGKPLTHLATDWRNVAPSSEYWTFDWRHASIGATGAAVFHKVQITEVTGRGRPTSTSADDPRQLAAWRVEGDFPDWIHFASDSRHLVTGWGKTIRDAESGKPLDGNLGWMRLFSPDGRLAVSDEEGVGLGVCGVDTGKRLYQIPSTGVSAAETFAPDGRHLAIYVAGQIELWNITTKPPTRVATERVRDANSAYGGPNALAFSRDGHRLLAAFDAAQDEPSVFIWSAPELKQLWAKPTPHFSCHWAEFSPDGSRVVAADWADAVLFDAADGGKLAQFPVPNSGSQRDIHPTFSPDGQLVLATWAEGGPLALYDRSTGRPTDRFRELKESVITAAWSPDGTQVLAACPGSVQLLDVATGREVTRFAVIGTVKSLAFRPDGRVAAIGTADGMVRLFRLPDPAAPTALGKATAK